jgi:hypothetical protein
MLANSRVTFRNVKQEDSNPPYREHDQPCDGKFKTISVITGIG